jgi:hypothetical protein
MKNMCKNNIKLIYLNKHSIIKIIKNHKEVEEEESSFLLILGDCTDGGFISWRSFVHIFEK